MKKTILFTLLVVAVSAITVGCSQKDSAKEQVDSSRQENDIEDNNAEKMAMLALQDSLRQDSIMKEEKFAKAVKSLEDIVSDSDVEKKLKRLGFTGNKKTSKRYEYDPLIEDQREIEVEKYNYTLKLGNKTITYQCDSEETMSWGTSTQKITIEGDEEALRNFYMTVKNRFDEVTLKGNTVILKSYSA